MLQRQTCFGQPEIALIRQRDRKHDDYRNNKESEHQPGRGKQGSATKRNPEGRPDHPPNTFFRSTIRAMTARTIRTNSNSVVESMVACPQRRVSSKPTRIYSAIITTLPPPSSAGI